MEPPVKDPLCRGCAVPLQEPYIRCYECRDPTVLICLHCFAKGLDLERHSSDHKYEVIKSDFAVFERGWTAAEERRLLDALSDCGIGNWIDVANHLQTKTAAQCEQHYLHHYVRCPHPLMPGMPSVDQQVYPCPIPIKYCEDPPRPAEGSQMQNEMSGYCAPRGDFNVEHENFAEVDLKDVELIEEDDKLDRELKFAVMDVYHNILKERARRKRIVRDYGLINIKKYAVSNRRFEISLGSDIVDKLRPLMKLLPPVEWDAYMESLHLVHQLQRDIERLQEFRTAGISHLRTAAVFTHLNKSRKAYSEQRHLLYNDVFTYLDDDAACQQWLKRQAALDSLSKGHNVAIPTAPRKVALPLDICGMPGYDRLSDKEKEICSVVRLVPESFLDFKNLLISECAKHGYLRLAQARSMIKIDVNKTRKIYDFLLEEGSITKDPS